MRTMSEEWKPSDELIVWAKEHLSQIGLDGLWSPDGSGVQYRKITDDTFALMFTYNHPSAIEHHERFTLLMEAAGYNVIEGDDVQVVTPPLDATAAQHEEYRRKQEIASGWQCECGYPLANNILEDREDKFIGVEEVLLSTGDTANVEVWSCVVECSNCGKHIDMNPDDFHLLAGDEIFMQWKCEDKLYVALDRGQMKDLADAGAADGVVLGSEMKGHKVPPWLWGCYAMPFSLEEHREERAWDEESNQQLSNELAKLEEE